MTERFSRQSFLGLQAQERIASVTVGVVGLGGGGSHVVQQLAHVGFQRYVLYDPDCVENSNLNRMVGSTLVDALAESSKLLVARRVIYGLQPAARVRAYPCRWQERPEPLKECEIVVGCVDGFRERDELERFCRQYLVHYVDIGMDVHGDAPPWIGGQVIQSSPGGLCMRCMGFLTERALAQEGGEYGRAGGRPQVVWPNGVLASVAVGLVVDLVTNWTQQARTHAHLKFDGNTVKIEDSVYLQGREPDSCVHFPPSDIGDSVFRPL